LKVPGDGVVIRRGQAGLNLDRRHVRAKLPGVAVRKTQRGCLGLAHAHDLANLVQVEVTDRDSLMGSGATGLDSRADGITLDVEHRDRGKMLGCLVRRLAGSLHLFDTGVGQQDHEWGVVAPVLSPGRDQVLALQVPAYAAELLIGQIQVLQQPACGCRQPCRKC
jgi:hypothetical protein